MIATLREALPAAAFAFDAAPARAFLDTHFRGYRDVRWHRLYAAATSRHAAEYVPDDLFYVSVLPGLNPPDRLAPYRDKNIAELVGVAPTPTTYARIVRGRLVGANRRPLGVTALEARIAEEADVVLKPARNTRQGKNLHRGSGAEIIDRLEALRCADRADDWIIQEGIQQHPSIARLNPTSLNTFRVLTMRIDTEICVLSTVLKIGPAGAIVDNVGSGGVGVAVASDGSLAAAAYPKNAVPALHHPDHGFAFASVRVPPPMVLHDACREAHDAIPDLDLVAWDAAIRSDGTAVLIEANVAEPSIFGHQLCTGPVFGEWTDRVLMPRTVRMLGPWLR